MLILIAGCFLKTKKRPARSAIWVCNFLFDRFGENVTNEIATLYKSVARAFDEIKLKKSGDNKKKPASQNRGGARSHQHQTQHAKRLMANDISLRYLGMGKKRVRAWHDFIEMTQFHTHWHQIGTQNVIVMMQSSLSHVIYRFIFTSRQKTSIGDNNNSRHEDGEEKTPHVVWPLHVTNGENSFAGKQCNRK